MDERQDSPDPSTDAPSVPIDPADQELLARRTRCLRLRGNEARPSPPALAPPLTLAGSGEVERPAA